MRQFDKPVALFVGQHTPNTTTRGCFITVHTDLAINRNRRKLATA